MGTASLQPNTEAEMIPVLDEFVRLGGTVFDTAENYGDSESILGRWMRERGNRDGLVILTKGAHPYGRNRVTPADITQDLHGSLKRLQTDYVDLYLLHRDDPSVPVEPIVEVLNEHLEAGRIRAIGASNWSWRRILEANEYAAKKGLRGFVLSSTNLSLAKPLEAMWPGCIWADEETADWHARNQLPLLAWAAQAGGFFTGRFAPGDRRDADMVRVYYSDANWERYRRAQELAASKGATAPQIALAYVLHQRFPTCGIVGSRNVAELRANYEATQLRLAPEESDWLDLRRERL
jgi:aryl-alcohol dehydrogenase-like predicted oxidoreductase